MASMLRMSVVNTSAGMVSMLGGFISSIIVARTLGVDGTGIVAYALWFMSVATLVADLGTPQATLRFIARDTGENLELRSGLFHQLFYRFAKASALAVLGIACYALWLLQRGQVESAFVWFTTIALYLSYAYSTLAIGAAQGLGQFDRAAQRTLIGCLIQPFAVLAGALTLGPAGAILGHAIRHLPQALDLRTYLSKKPSNSNPIPTEIRHYARNNWISGSILALFGARIELAIIGFFFTITQVGFYAIGLTMTGMIAQLALFIVAFVVPKFGELHDEANDQAFANAFEGTIRWLSIVIAPITIGGAAIAPALIPLVFGDDFVPAVGPAIILLVFSIAQALAAVLSRAILAKNRSSDELRISLVWCGLSIVVLLVVVPFFGQTGAAWARGALNALLLVILASYCSRALSLHIPILTLVKSIAAAGICATTALGVLQYVSGVPGLLLAVAAAAPVYVLTLMLLRTIPTSELEPFANEIKSRIGTNRLS